VRSRLDDHFLAVLTWSRALLIDEDLDPTFGTWLEGRLRIDFDVRSSLD
jgi:hypothetical protein